MPKSSKGSNVLGKPISIRLPPDEEAYYRRQAAAHRMSVNAFLAKTLVSGVTAENMLDFEERISALIASIPQSVQGGSQVMPDALMLSVLTCEALLTAVVSAQSQQTLYDAQDAAKTRFKKISGGGGNG